MATFINSPLKSTFIHIPKNAGSSISQWLKINIDCYNVKRRHDTATILREKYGELGWSFCVVRNPWDRMVSLYYYKTKEPQRRIDILKQTNNHPKKHKLRWQIAPLEKQIANAEKTFEEYILNKSWIKERNQIMWHDNVDYVMKMETLEKDFETVQDRLNCYVSLHKTNSTEHKSYQDLYTNAMKDIVYKHFKQDINFHNYEF